MHLFFREYGSYSDRHPTLIFLHGLFGSSSNWHSIVRRLESHYHIIVPDLRNHGRSPHSALTDYPSLAADIAQLIDEHGLDDALLIGHSMGGKTAMWLALENPSLVSALVVVDIAPVDYDHRHSEIFNALREIPLATLRDREQATQILTGRLGDSGLARYLLQNLVRQDGSWQWRFNLPALEEQIGVIAAFPTLSSNRSYAGRTLFIHGSSSSYVAAEHRAPLRALFPHARLRAIQGAGHWVYAEQPDAFFETLSRFLEG